MSESKVHVAVRIRPLLGKEKIERCTTCVEVLSERELLMGGDKQFTFDHVFGLEDDQENIYSRCVSPLVENLFDGYNATVLAYGQTGSGKTFTMGSGCSAPDALNPLVEKDRGVIPRATAQIFDIIARKRSSSQNAEFYLRVQFLELYGENLRDLLDPVGTAQSKQVSIRDGPNDSLQIVGAMEETVKSPLDMLALLEKGTLCRTTGSTDMNTHSSRSHAIFTIVLEQQLKQTNTDEGEEGETEYRTSKFHFVDLAGSERAKRTGATGQRMREGININMGLLALGNVISALGAEDGSAPRFVPYRDSKLTRMLQDSLGGNSRTLMIACISPADINFEETLNALRYANRARNIKNRAVINRDPSSSQIAALKAQIAQLKAQIASGGGVPVLVDDATGFENPQADYKTKCRMLEEEVNRLLESLESEKRTRLELENRYAVLEQERIVLLGSDASSLESGEELEDSRNISTVEEEEEDEEEEAGLGAEDSMQERETAGANEDEDDQSAKLLKQRFHRSQKALKKLFSTYDQTLKSKEEAMRQIMEERAKFEALKTHFESKMAEMNEEVRETQAQREVLEQKLKELESEQQQTDVSRSEALKLRAQMAEKEKRLRELEDRTRQLNEARKAVTEWQRKESVVRTEIEHVKRDKVELQRRMTENHKKHLEELRDHKLEIAGLKRERARLEQDTNQLAARTERDSRLIQQKSEQVAAMQRKLREAQRLTQHPQALSQREKKQRQELERLAALQVKREEELQDLRRALAKKEEAITRRNQLLEQLEKLRSEQSEQQPESIPIQELVPEATQEDLRELEQRLEVADSEILFRDRQCRAVLQKEDVSETQESGEQVILTLSSLDQAKDVCRILMQMFVESKKELRERKLELDRVRHQVLHQDQAVKFERRRTETFLHGVGTPTRHAQRAQDEVEPEAQEIVSLGPVTPAKPDEVREQLIASEVRIKKIEAKLRSLRVDETTDGNSGTQQPVVQAGAAGSKRNNNVPVWDRLTSPSAATGIHKYGAQVMRRASGATSLNQSTTATSPTDEEECIDEITKVVPSRRQNRGSLTSKTIGAGGLQEAAEAHSEEEATQGPPGRFAARFEAILADAAPETSPEKPKATAAVWERVSSQFTESYHNKRLLDAEARQRASTNYASRGRQTSPGRRPPPPPMGLTNAVPGKENLTSRGSASTVSQQSQGNPSQDLWRVRKEHLATERARRRKQSQPNGVDAMVGAKTTVSEEDVTAPFEDAEPDISVSEVQAPMQDAA